MFGTLTPQQKQMYLQQLAMQNSYMTNMGMNSFPLMPDEPPPPPPKEVQREPPKPEKLKVKLRPSEHGAYSSLFDVASGGKGSKINGKEAADFLSRSGLPKETLREIWTIADQNEEMALTRENFYIALRLVALAQNQHQVSAESIVSDIEVPLPKFKGTLGSTTGPGQESLIDPSSNKYSITDEDIQKYAQIYSNMDAEQKGYLTSSQIDIILGKLNLPSNIGNTLKVICDENGTDTFKLPMAIVAIHLARLATRGVPLPRTVPQSLKKKVETTLGFPQPTTLPNKATGGMSMGSVGFSSSSTMGGIGAGMNAMGPMNNPSIDETSSSGNALGIIKKEISDKKAEIIELRNEEAKLKAKVEELKGRNKTFGVQLQRMKDELANLKRSNTRSNTYAAQPIQSVYCVYNE